MTDLRTGGSVLACGFSCVSCLPLNHGWLMLFSPERHQTCSALLESMGMLCRQGPHLHALPSSRNRIFRLVDFWARRSISAR